jgi:hypothetical protein
MPLTTDRESRPQPNERLRHRPAKNSSSGGRTWWAHFEFTRINIEPIILRKNIEDPREAGATRLRLAFILYLEVSGRHAEDSRPILETQSMKLTRLCRRGRFAPPRSRVCRPVQLSILRPE